MQYVTVIHHGFHGRTHLRFRPLRRHVSSSGGTSFEVSKLVADRLNRAVCPVSGCECGAQVAFGGDVTDSCNPGYGRLDYHGSSDHWFIYIPTSGQIFDRYANK